MNRWTIPFPNTSQAQRKLGRFMLVAISLMMLLSACAQSQQPELTPPSPDEAASPSELPALIPTSGATATIVPQSAFTAVPLTTQTPQVFDAPKETVTMEPGTSPASSNSIITRWITQATEDLARRLNVSPDAIKFTEFEPVVWPDGGLGCPEPGVMYTQVMVEGFRIHLEHDGKTYYYHGSMERPPFLCEAK